MDSRHKILILDDDPVFLELYKEWLSQLPSKPEIHTSTSGARAMALLPEDQRTAAHCFVLGNVLFSMESAKSYELHRKAL